MAVAAQYKQGPSGSNGKARPATGFAAPLGCATATRAPYRRRHTLISAFIKAVAQLSDPRFRRVLLVGVIAALITYLLLNGLVWWLLVETQLFQTGWLDTAIDVLGGVVTFVVTLIFFPAVVTIVVSALLDQIAEAVEARHYPHLPAARERPLIEDVLTTLRFAGISIILNLLALPVYLLLMPTGLGIVLFYTLNGYLLSREYFELVALRRLSADQVSAMRRVNFGYLWVAGAGITFLLSVPVLNLFAPIIATAFMVHLFQSMRRRQSAE